MSVAVIACACAINSPGLQGSGPDTTGSLPGGDATKQTASVARPTKAKVALILPLSGQGNLAVLAKAMKQAGEMALFDAASPEFQLLVKDDLGTPEGARAAAEEAVRDGAEIILGPLLAASVDAVVPVAASARIPVVAFSNDRRVIRPGVHLMSFMPEQDVERIVGYAASKGRRNFAALVSDDAYGGIVEEAFKKAVAARQGNLIAVERYGRAGSTLDATRRIADALAAAGAPPSLGAPASSPGGAALPVTASGVGAAPPSPGAGDGSEALLVPGDPETLMSLGPLIAYARIDTARVKLLGTGGWDSPNLGRDATYVGGWYPAPDPRGWQAFSEKFNKSFGSTPPRLAALSFDAVGVALALSSSGAGERMSSAGLMRPSGFQTSDGLVRFNQDGTVVRSLGVHEVQEFAARMISDPQSPGLGSPSAGAQPARAVSRPQQVN